MKHYFDGLILSLLFTLLSFGLVGMHVHMNHTAIPHELLYVVLPLFAVAQLLVQTVYFLHLPQGNGWNKFVYGFAILIVVLVVGGSLWIMSNLQHNQSEMFIGEPSPEHQLD